MKTSYKIVAHPIACLTFDFKPVKKYILCRYAICGVGGFLEVLLGRSQVVRQRPLEPPLVGSNPAAPA